MKDFGENVHTYGVLNVLRFKELQVRSAAKRKGKEVTEKWAVIFSYIKEKCTNHSPT